MYWYSPVSIWKSKKIQPLEPGLEPSITRGSSNGSGSYEILIEPVSVQRSMPNYICLYTRIQANRISSPLEPGNIRDAMCQCKVFTGILPCGTLPALSQHISRASKLGIFENRYCLGCLSGDVTPETLLDVHGFI